MHELKQDSKNNNITIVNVDISEIIPYENNARINNHTVDAPANSISDFGFQQPIVLDKNKTIIVGHTRYKAALKLGMKTCPCIIADHLSDKQVAAYRIVDNKVGELSNWNLDILKSELNSELLQNCDFLSQLSAPSHVVKMFPLQELKEHPQNYKQHPDDQIEHLMQSIKENGIYKNIVISNDGTILAGHGIVKAANKLGLKTIPVLQLGIEANSVKALKLLAADNEVQHLAEDDDRALTNILKEIMNSDSLLGTGFDDKMLANLLFVTRPKGEINNIDEAKEWVGMPEFELSAEPSKIIVSFESDTQKEIFCNLIGIEVPKAKKSSTWFPPKETQDLTALKIEQKSE